MVESVELYCSRSAAQIIFVALDSDYPSRRVFMVPRFYHLHHGKMQKRHDAATI
jgi:hypothetical protein